MAILRRISFGALLALSVCGFGQRIESHHLAPYNSVVKMIDPTLAGELIDRWGWGFKGPYFGGSFKMWAVPATAFGHEFFLQGITVRGHPYRKDSKTHVYRWVSDFEVRLQRHPAISDGELAWANSVKRDGFDLFVQKGFGFEASTKISLVGGVRESDLRAKILKFLKKVVPIADRLNGGKTNFR